jgi:hypothetical protein
MTSVDEGDARLSVTTDGLLQDIKSFKPTDIPASSHFDMALYPSPTLTPLTSCAPTPPWVKSPTRLLDTASLGSAEALIRLQFHPQATQGSRCTKRRKGRHPKPSILSNLTEAEKDHEKIFKLDVFDVFLDKPHSLMYRTSKVNDSPNDEASCLSLPVLNEKKAPTLQKTCSSNIMKHIPTYLKDPSIVDSVDMSLFKQTQSAPCVSWKGRLMVHV